MSDFEDALDHGFEAHRDAVRAKNEIFETFNELSEAVSNRTAQRVRVQASRVEKRTVKTLAALAGSLVSHEQTDREVVTNQLPDDTAPDGLFAIPVGAEHGKRAQLCGIKLDPRGYPVEVTFEGNFQVATDYAALKAILVRLLKHPDVAGKIQQVSNLSVLQPGTSAG